MPSTVVDAIAAGDLAAVTRLVQQQRPLDERNDAGISPLILAAYDGPENVSGEMR